MANTTLSKDEILDAIGNMSVIELSDLIEAFKRSSTSPSQRSPPAAAGRRGRCGRGR
jgi:ribosomal protein L7/L12